MDKIKSVGLRYATLEDSGDLRTWRNDYETVKQSINNKPVTETEHEKWMEKSINNKHYTLLFIAEAVINKKPVKVGTVRLDKINYTIWDMSFTVNPMYRKRGVAGLMIKQLLRFAQDNNIVGITCQAKIDNIASNKIITDNGFFSVSNDIIYNYYYIKLLQR